MFHIGILQMTQNLDDAVNGFKDGLKALGIQADFSYRNADGNERELPRLAKKLAEEGPDLIFACSTPAAKAAKAAAGAIPVLFTPVFDPVGVKLVDSMAKPGGNITGASGMVKAADKVRFIASLLPRANKLGVLYHAEDENARIETARFTDAAKNRFVIEPIAIGGQEELSLLEEKLPEGLDAIFLPIGKIIEDNFSSIAYYADALGVPLIASHAPNVVLGALGALTANHQKLGASCAGQAKQILVDGVLPGNIPVQIADFPDILLNASVAENLNIHLPEELVKAAAAIYD